MGPDEPGGAELPSRTGVRGRVLLVTRDGGDDPSMWDRCPESVCGFAESYPRVTRPLSVVTGSPWVTGVPGSWGVTDFTG
jgi:hypothetical protein